MAPGDGRRSCADCPATARSAAASACTSYESPGWPTLLESCSNLSPPSQTAVCEACGEPPDRGSLTEREERAQAVALLHRRFRIRRIPRTTTAGQDAPYRSTVA